MNEKCWRLLGVDGKLPAESPLTVGGIVRFSNSNPAQAVFNRETSEWVALRWAKCADPREVTA